MASLGEKTPSSWQSRSARGSGTHHIPTCTRTQTRCQTCWCTTGMQATPRATRHFRENFQPTDTWTLAAVSKTPPPETNIPTRATAGFRTLWRRSASVSPLQCPGRDLCPHHHQKVHKIVLTFLLKVHFFSCTFFFFFFLLLLASH